MTITPEVFGKLEPSAHFLLERAAELARGWGQEIDPLQVMLVVLSEPPVAGSAGQSLATYISDDARKMCEAAIRVQLQLNGTPAATPGTPSAHLQRCITLWNQEAQRRNLRVTEALVMWAVATRDPVVSQILRTLAVDLDGLARDLERHFEITSRLPPLSLTRGAEVREHTEIISPSAGCQFATAHAVLMSNVLTVLGGLDHSQIAMLSGRNGTPIHHVEQVLADIFAAGTSFSEERPRLQHDYQGVYRLNLAGVLNLTRLPNKPKPFEVLQETLRLAAQERALLVIHNLELLRAHSEVDEQVLAVLCNPEDALVLGVYEQAEYADRGPSATLRLPNSVDIVAHPASATQTKTLIQEYYLPHWMEKYHITFADDAFNHIIALEPGAWINSRRKTLPYLVYGLASDTIETCIGGESLVRDTATMALDALEKLLDEAATTDVRIRDRFEPVLEEACEEITQLLQRPIPEPNAQGLRVLSRAHVSAQLICPNNSEFHYPGHAPEALGGQQHDDLPTHLREAIYFRDL